MLTAILIAFTLAAADADAGLPWVRVADDGRGFVLDPSGKPFRPWGFNYDHDTRGRLLEDYWNDEWPTVAADFAEMHTLGANVVRIHLQLARFMRGPNEPDKESLDRLGALVALAAKERLYLDLTGLGCYHKQDVPAWYDALAERDRWEVQARFWHAVAGRCAGSPAVFCYDLMNEPVAPAGHRDPGAWLGPPLGDKHFVQMIALDQADRPRPEIARRWIRQLVTAIRQADRRHLITVGLVDWSLDRPGLTSGFVPAKIAPELDFLAVHLYPEQGHVKESLATLAGFNVGKPVLIEETFPLKCSPAELGQFLEGAGQNAAGLIGFYWGTPPDELRRPDKLADALLLGWLDWFVRQANKASSAQPAD